ncbi:MAG: hypothetical protein EZS28_015760 [Streblomastix strix]|uniref:Uncharacterized protein n=1 Tax=Streblomastix strix TaxID=222440 RepID=A0A5J4W1Z4_9EUKA|nr:MAG: hypothetical protein EZS28_015760 [Streblomastix strix]
MEKEIINKDYDYDILELIIEGVLILIDDTDDQDYYSFSDVEGDNEKDNEEGDIEWLLDGDVECDYGDELEFELDGELVLVEGVIEGEGLNEQEDEQILLDQRVLILSLDENEDILYDQKGDEVFYIGDEEEEEYGDDESCGVKDGEGILL